MMKKKTKNQHLGNKLEKLLLLKSRLNKLRRWQSQK